MNSTEEGQGLTQNILKMKDINTSNTSGTGAAFKRNDNSNRFIRSKHASEKYRGRPLINTEGQENNHLLAKVLGKARKGSSCPSSKGDINTTSIKEGEKAKWLKQEGPADSKGINLSENELKVVAEIAAEKMEPVIKAEIKEAMPIIVNTLQEILENDHDLFPERWDGPRHKTYIHTLPAIQNIENEITNIRRSKKALTNPPYHGLAFGKKPDVEKKEYKANVIKTTLNEEVNVEAMKQYKIEFELENSGDIKWPENVRLVCIRGICEGNEKMLPCLEPGRSIVTRISLLSPKKPGKYLTQWKIFYGRGQKQGSFGESIFKEIHVFEKRLDEGDKIHASYTGQDVYQGSSEKKENKGESPEREKKGDSMIGMEKNKPFRQDKATCARFLDQVFPGNLQEKYEFMNKFEQDLTVAEAVEKYLMMQENKNK